MKSNIDKLISEKGYQKKFVAKQVGVSPTQLSLWISMRNFPRADKLFKLAQVLNCKVDDLYEYEEEK
ncbi:helix-turn-helix transcriptional regulator [Priestia sp. FSL W8-0524]|uniref:helix-turn-helix domain-containing protein n=1 Tax=Priestia sp. FSL W8-0524 TaxID=2954625 RepID=UPI0030F98820